MENQQPVSDESRRWQEYMAAAYSRYRGAHQRFLWWLAGIAYALFCFVGPKFRIVRELTVFIFLNNRGAFVLAIICVVGGIDAFRHRRDAWREYQDFVRGYINSPKSPSV